MDPNAPDTAAPAVNVEEVNATIAAHETNLAAAVAALEPAKEAAKTAAAGAQSANGALTAAKNKLKAATDDDREELQAAAALALTTYNTAKEAADAAKAQVKTINEYIKTTKAAVRDLKKVVSTAAKPATSRSANRIKQNGVLLPLPDSLCGKAWAIFDELSASTGQPALLADAMPIAAERGLVPGNVRAEYGAWRKFHGVPPQGRKPKPVAEPATPAPETQPVADMSPADNSAG